jgi:hypothetical protein
MERVLCSLLQKSTPLHKIACAFSKERGIERKKMSDHPALKADAIKAVLKRMTNKPSPTWMSYLSSVSQPSITIRLSTQSITAQLYMANITAIGNIYVAMQPMA